VRLGRSHRKPVPREVEDVILFAVGDLHFAISANAVDEIRNLDGLEPYARGRLAPCANVKYTLLRSNENTNVTYFVIDAASHFQISHGRGGRVLILRIAGAAVLVDQIERMTQIGTVVALPQAFTGKEREWYRGLAVIDQRVYPVVEPSAFLSKAEIAVLRTQEQNISTATVGGEVPA
jgi:chemotaxis signal transduction protein